MTDRDRQEFLSQLASLMHQYNVQINFEEETRTHPDRVSFTQDDALIALFCGWNVSAYDVQIASQTR